MRLCVVDGVLASHFPDGNYQEVSSGSRNTAVMQPTNKQKLCFLKNYKYISLIASPSKLLHEDEPIYLMEQSIGPNAFLKQQSNVAKVLSGVDQSQVR